MTDYVFLQKDIEHKSEEKESQQICFNKICNYAKMLKLPVTLSMFIPCDSNGNIFLPPEKLLESNNIMEAYNNAKEHLIFKNPVKFYTQHYRQTERILIDLDCKSPIRIFNRLKYRNGGIEDRFLPNLCEIPTLEYFTQYDLTLTDFAVKKFGI